MCVCFTFLRIISSCLCLYCLLSHFLSRLSRAPPLRPADYPLPPFAPPTPPAPQTQDCISQQAPRLAANEGLRIWRRRRRRWRRRSESRVGGLCARRRRRRERAAAAAAAVAAVRTEAEAEGDCPLVAAERRAKAKSSPEDLAAPAGPPATAFSLAAEAARRPPILPPPLPTPPPAAFLLSASRPARPGRGPSRCRQPWQRRPARGKSSPGISCGLARFRVLPPRPRRLPAPQPHSGPPCLSCDRTDTAGGLEWNKLKVK